MAFRLAAPTRYPGHSIEGIDRPDQDPQGSGAWVKGAKVDGVDTISAQPIELMN
jgi:hypothetical protein